MSQWRLTAKQAAVMDMVVEGHCNKSIARKLGVGVKTVEAHVSAVRKLMAVDNRTRAAVLWDRRRQQGGAPHTAPTRYAWTAAGMKPAACGAWLMDVQPGA